MFLYPNNKVSPNGKLRLLYECIPASFIMEIAGGLGTNGTENILDIKPTKIHDSTQLFLGANEYVTELKECLKTSLWGYKGYIYSQQNYHLAKMRHSV